jgi:prepilin-type N-terminal cleavage/methylation domain-containing protein
MNHLKSKTMGSKGFTLVEIIVTIVAAGILGAIFVQLMGTALSSSWNSVEIVRDESNAERLMERIVGEYVALINNDPDTALDIIDDYHGQTIYGINISANYIEFDAGGSEVIIGPPPATGETLKVVLQAPGQVVPAIRFRYPLTAILTQSRTATDDQIVIY